MKEILLAELNKEIIDIYPEEIIISGHGNINSPIMLLGEAPGAKEIELGEPFVGQAGKHFEEFLKILEFERQNVYITNSVKYRPTRINAKTGRKSNRTPTNGEIETFRPYIYREIDIIKPIIIATMGNIPLKVIFEDGLKIGEVHGRLIKREIRDRTYNIFPLYHPAAIIYRRELKDTYIQDLLDLKITMKKYIQ